MPRHQYEQQFWECLQKGLLSGKYDFFFPFMRTRGNPHRPIAE